MTATPEPEATPTPPPPAKRRKGTARRRRLAYLLAAAILLIAGVVAGVVATRPTPKRHHVAVAVVKPKPKPKPVNHDLTLAAFMTRWNRLVAGPSDVATGRVVAYENRFGKILAEKYEAVSVAIASPSLWHWVVPHLSPPAATYGAGRAATTGTATPTGTTTTRTWRPNTITLPGGATTTETASPIVTRWGTGGYVVMAHSLPVVRVQRLALGDPLRTLVLQRVVASTRTSWVVRFDEVAASGTQTGQSTQVSPPPRHYEPPSQLPPGFVAPAFGPHAPYGASIPLTLTVTPTAQGGPEIDVPNVTLLANPTPGGAP